MKHDVGFDRAAWTSSQEDVTVLCRPLWHRVASAVRCFVTRHSIASLCLASAVLVGEVAGSEPAKYPPYPDVWGYEFPWNSPTSRYIGLTAFPQPNGDFLFTYATGLGGPRHGVRYTGIRFFGGNATDFTGTEYDRLWSQFREVPRPGAVRFSDGSAVVRGAACLGNCCPKYSSFLRKIDANGRELLRKSVFYVSDREVRLGIGRYCEHNSPPGDRDEIRTKVVQVSPFFVPLADDTFLLADSDGNVVIRLTSELKSPSALFGRKLVLIDRHLVEEMQHDPKTGAAWSDQSTADALEAYIKASRRTGGSR